MITFGVEWTSTSPPHCNVVAYSTDNQKAIITTFRTWEAADEYCEFMGFLSTQFEQSRQK